MSKQSVSPCQAWLSSYISTMAMLAHPGCDWSLKKCREHACSVAEACLEDYSVRFGLGRVVSSDVEHLDG